MNWSEVPVTQISRWELADLRSLTAPEQEPESEPDLQALALETARAEAREAAIREMDVKLAETVAQLRAEHARELDEVRASADSRVANACGVLAGIERDLRAHTAVWTETVRDNVLAIAIAAARQIVGAAVDQNPELVAERVDHAMSRLPKVDGPVTVRLNPVDLAALEEVSATERLAQVRWVADERVSRGGCVIEAGSRLIDADVDRALAALYREVSRG